MSLSEFLNSHFVHKDERSTKVPTHMWCSKKLSYNKMLHIPAEKNDQLLSLYSQYLTEHPESATDETSILALTEKVGQVFPLFADVDLKLKMFAENTLITDLERIMQYIITAWQETVKTVFSVKYADDMVLSFRMPYKAHLFFPSTIVNREIAVQLCEKVKSLLVEQTPELAEIYKEAVDSSVYSSGLRMLGSQKGNMGSEQKVSEEQQLHQKLFPDVPYEHVYRIGDISDSKEGTSVIINDTVTLEDLKTASIHTSEVTLTPIKEGAFFHKAAAQKTERAKKVQSDCSHNESYDSLVKALQKSTVLQDILDDISFVKIRPFSRSNDLEMTLAPQICPFAKRMHTRTSERNTPSNYLIVTPDTIRVKCWKCPKDYKINHAEALTLNCDYVNSLQKKNLSKMIEKSIFMTSHETVSEVVFHLLKNEYAASPYGKSGAYKWYFYDRASHRWAQYEKIVLAITGGKGPVQVQYLTHYDMRVKANDFESDEKKKEFASASMQLRFKLQDTNYVKGGLLPLIARKLEFYWRDKQQDLSFENRLDTNPKLVSFVNGVFDLRHKVFRSGSPHDFISMTTRNYYTPYDQITPSVRQDLEDFLATIFPDPEHLNYILQEMGSGLDGTPTQQRFFMFIGPGGANGKSTFIRQLECAFGDYVKTASTSMVTQQRPPGNQTSSDFAALRGARYVIMNEPNEKDTLFLGTIKTLTGGDTIPCRRLYENDILIRLQATFFMLTNNPPNINATVQDGGSWRRLVPITFNSKFVENPSSPREFKIDDEIDAKMELWKEAFASLLIKNALVYKRAKKPAEFVALWRSLQNRNDHYHRFINDQLTEEKENFIESTVLFRHFRDWMKSMNVSKNTTFDSFEKNMIYGLGEPVLLEGHKGWNVQIKTIPII